MESLHRLTKYSPRGFTLIELMIVVALSGMVATILLPVPDYKIRARVTEGLMQAGTAKTAVMENAAHGAAFATGWTAPQPTGDVASVAISAMTGEITVTYTKNIPGAGTLILAPSVAGAPLAGTLTASEVPGGGPVTWNCNALLKPADNVGSSGTLPVRYAPSQCRA